MMRFSKILLVTATLALGACSHYSDDLSSLDGSMKANPNALAYNSTVAPQNIAPAAGGPAGSINTFLARDYYELARYENDKAYDYKAAKQFTQKAMNAQKGTFTAPSKISSFDVPSNRVPELTQARADLVAALKTQNTPENGPSLAKAQSSFDCWLERAEEADEDTHYAECKGQFEQSMASLMMPAAGDVVAPTVYNIGFLQTSAVPDEAAKKTREYIAGYLQQPENAPLKVALSAPVDEVGKARIAAVLKAITDKGVTPDRVSITVPEVVASTGVQAVNDTVQVMILGSSASSTTTTTTTYVPVTPTPVAPTAPAPVMPAPAPVGQ
jgi:hypothetical protein